MRYVYANAALNVCASASDNPHGGLFQSRDDETIRPGMVDSTLGSDSPESYHIFDKGYWDRQILAGPLHRRGWVFQERFLSPRQLYFGKHQVLWECLEEHRCEGFPRGIPLHDSSKSIERLLEMPKNDEGPEQGQMSFEALDLWIDLVTSYSHCHFTNPEDKLYAFGGIAKLFQEVTGDTYIAGIWRSKILHQLDWCVFVPKPRLTKQYRAPSWSWASIDGPVKPTRPAHGFEFLAEVLEVGVSSKEGQHSTVFVADAFIRLRGAIITAGYTRDPTNDSLRIEMKDKHAFGVGNVYPDTTDVYLSGNGTISFLLLKSQQVYWEIRDSPESGSYTRLTCIILSMVSEPTTAYRRIGCFNLDGDRQPEIVKELMSASSTEKDVVLIV